MKLLKSKQFWVGLLGLGLLAYCVKDIHVRDIEALAGRMEPLYLLCALAAAITFQVVKAFRWRLMISNKRNISRWHVLTLYAAGQVLNIVMPALTGQVGRLFLFSRNERLKKSFIFSTIVLELLFDAISLVVFVLLMSMPFVVPSEYRLAGYIVAGFTVLLLVLLYFALHYQHGIEEFGRLRIRHRWPSAYIGVRKFLRSFLQGIELLKSSQHFFGMFAYSFGSWILHTAVVYFLLRSFGLDLPLVAAASIILVNTLALMIPLTPGNAGTFEFFVSRALQPFEVGRSDAVLFAIALHLVDLLPISILGLIYLKHEKISIRDIQKEKEAADIFEVLPDEASLVEDER